MKKISIAIIIVLFTLALSGCTDKSYYKEGDDLDTNYMPNEEVYFYVDNSLIAGSDFTVFLMDNDTVINTIHNNKPGRYVFNPRPKPGRYTIMVTNKGYLGDVVNRVFINVW